MTTPATADDALPVRVRVSAHAVPETEMPFEDGGPPARPCAKRPLTPWVPRATPPPPPLRLVDPWDDDEEDACPPGELEDPVPRAAMLTRALLEVVAGVRPLGQLEPWVSEEVLPILQSLVASRATRPSPAVLRRVLVSEPLPGIAEVTAVVQRGLRAEAMALRLEGRDGRWVVTTLQRG